MVLDVAAIVLENLAVNLHNSCVLYEVSVMNCKKTIFTLFIVILLNDLQRIRR